MDSIFSKFSLYDFMGIWGPGAIGITYFSYTLYEPLTSLMKKLSIAIPEINGVYAFIIFYTAVAYIVGLVLHELGRQVANWFNIFHGSEINIPEKEEISKGSRPNCFRVFLFTKWEFCQKMCEVIPDDKRTDITYNKALTFLKYHFSGNLDSINTLHSIYAMSRSISLLLLLHIVAVFAAFICKYQISFTIIVIDVLLFFLFYVRTYRYFYYWVESLYIQYYYSCVDNYDRSSKQ